MGSTPTTTRYNLCFNIISPIVFSSISCNKLHATRRIISYCSVACILMHKWFHLGAWFTISYLMHDRARHRTLFNPFEHLRFRATSCTLRGALFHTVACILMHEWFHLGAWFAISCLMHDRTARSTLFNPFEHLQFRATSCTLRWFGGCRAVDFYLSCGFLRGIKWCGIAKVVPPTGLEPVTNRLWVDCSDRLSYGGGKSVADYREFCC